MSSLWTSSLKKKLSCIQKILTVSINRCQDVYLYRYVCACVRACVCTLLLLPFSSNQHSPIFPFFLLIFSRHLSALLDILALKEGVTTLLHGALEHITGQTNPLNWWSLWFSLRCTSGAPSFNQSIQSAGPYNWWHTTQTSIKLSTRWLSSVLR